MTTLNPQDPNLSGFDDSAYEQEKEDERIEQARLESEQQMAELRQGRSTEPQQPEPKPAKKKGGKFLDGMLDALPSYAEQGADGKIDCNIWLENSSGEKTTPGSATVYLPSRSP